MRPAVAIALIALIGCSDETGGVFITANWRFRSVTSSLDQMCPPDATTVVMQVRGPACPGGECPEVNNLICEDGTGLSGKLDPGVYDVWLEFGDANGNLFTTTTPETLDLTLGDKTYSRQVLLDGGVFKVAWRLLSSNGATERTCEEGGAFGIYVSASPDNDPSTANNDELDCEDQFGYTFPYAAGFYTVNIEAVNDSGQTLGLAEPLTSKQIMAPNQVTDLGTIDIVLSGTPPGP